MPTSDLKLEEAATLTRPGPVGRLVRLVIGVFDLSYMGRLVGLVFGVFSVAFIWMLLVVPMARDRGWPIQLACRLTSGCPGGPF